MSSKFVPHMVNNVGGGMLLLICLPWMPPMAAMNREGKDGVVWPGTVLGFLCIITWDGGNLLAGNPS